MRRSFLEDCMENTYAFEKSGINMMITNVSSIADYPQLNESIFPFYYMDEALNNLSSMMENVSLAEKFFTNAYKSKLLNDVPLTIPVADINEVKEIKPKYLIQYVNKSASYLEGVTTTGKVTSDAQKLESDEFTKNLKRQVVVSELPEYIKDKDLIKMDTRFIHTVDSAFISAVVLPTLRMAEAFRKEQTKICATIKACITDANSTINEYVKTFNRLHNEGKTGLKATKVLNDIIRNYIVVSRFMMIAFIRKVNAFTINLREFSKLQQTLVHYFPNEGEFHESVLDGVNDFENSDNVYSLTNGDVSFITSVIQRLERTFTDWMEEDARKRNCNMTFEAFEYDKKSYQSVIATIKTIGVSLKTFYDLLQNPDTSIEDILEKSGFAIPMVDQYEYVLSAIPDTSFYTEYEGADKWEVYKSILCELQDADKTISDLGKSFHILYRKLKSIEESVKDNINDQYTNHERNIETLDAIRDIESSFRNFLGKFASQILLRYSNIEDILEDTENQNAEIINSVETNDDFTDYAQEAVSYNLDLMESVHIEDLNEMYHEFNKAIYESYFEDIADVIMEADQAANNVANNGNQNAQANTNTNASATNNNNNQNQNNSLKATVNDNGNTTNTADNTSGGGNTGDKKSIIQKIVDAVKKFMLSLGEKMTKLGDVNRKNYQWIQNNKSALTSRSYTNTSINILPYREDGGGFIEVIKQIGNNMKGITRDTLVKTNKEKLESLLIKGTNIKSLKLPKGVEDTVSNRFTQYFKVGTNPMELVTKKDSEVAQFIPKAISVCETYYSPGYAEQCKNELNGLVSSVENGLNTILNSNPAGQNDDAQAKVTALSTLVNTIVGCALNAMRDQAQDYLKVLQAFAPKANNANQNNQQNNQQDQNAEQGNENTENNQ